MDGKGGGIIFGVVMKIEDEERWMVELLIMLSMGGGRGPRGFFRHIRNGVSALESGY